MLSLRSKYAEQYPDTKFREEISFMILRSAFLLADNGIDSKKVERFEQAVRECEEFVERYPRSKQLEKHRILRQTVKKH